MPNIDIAQKLSACRNYTQAKPILETVGASRASHELMQLYFAQPDNSPYRTRFLTTVVQEVEDGINTEKSKSGPHDKGKLQEVDNGTSTQSSGDKPEDEGIKKGISSGDSLAEPTESQMKEGLMGMPGMDGLPPEMQQQFMGAMNKAPPMNPLQQMKMMQYTIKEAMKGPMQTIQRLQESVKSLDSKIQEMETKSITLDINGGDKLSLPRIQETLPSGPIGPEYGYGAQPPPSRDNLTEKRMRIQETDRILTITKKGGDVSQMYQ